MINHHVCKTKIRALVIALASILGAAHGYTAPSLSDSPLASAPSASIRPNVMFVLDDSGSMGEEYLPDGIIRSNLCFGTAAVNRIFYDPTKRYPTPPRADGTAYPDSSFTNAPTDGFSVTSVRRDLSNLINLSTPTTEVASNTVSKFYYAVYTGNGTPTCSGNGYRIRDFAVVTSSTAIAAPSGVNAQTNYANWYSYYRTRMLTTRSAAGRVFADIDATRFRVGFSTIHTNTQVNDGTEFLNIRNFDSGTQKADFFTRLYGTVPGGFTPLRSALGRAGRYYANKIPGQTDPVEYACQRNYTILSTDGYWNSNEDPQDWNAQLGSNANYGNQDGPGTPGIARPQLDDVGTGTNTGGAGASNTLADVAQYYYNTDLRTPALGNCTGAVAGQDVCANIVSPVIGVDPATYQHMNTITLGLGVSGQLVYDPNYLNQTSGDFFNLKQGSKAWPNPITNDTTARIDDLWHAAVNGRGKYYSASDAVEVANSLEQSLQAIDSQRGSGAAAATSNLQPVAGDNFVFLATYQTKFWVGNLTMFEINENTGVVSTTAKWLAAAKLNAKFPTDTSRDEDSRNIFFFNSASGTKLSPFLYSNLSNLPTPLNSNFDNLCPASGTGKLSQCASLGATDRDEANKGVNVVNYLRGRVNFENTPGKLTNKLFRNRIDDQGARNVLGDIVNSVPVYVKKPNFRYADTGYANFASSNAVRPGTVYTAANDGMLHAFDALTGDERWAYVPTAVMSNMYRLADEDYGNNHRFLADGAPTVGDIYDGSAWSTILVAGLNKGGRSYYALDVTDPAAPKGLWEFTEPDLGYTFGNPIITKLKSGTWVVVFSSGYSDGTLSGSGNGFLYVLNAKTGALISKIPTFTSGTTPAGTASAPSNMGAINAWVDRTFDNTVSRIYGADMLGNVWRFDVDDNLGPTGNEAFLLAQARTGSGAVQPITTKPELSEIKVGGTRYALVSVGTGRYLGADDPKDSTLQSVYTFKDTLSNTSLGNLRANTGMVSQTLGALSGTTRAARTIVSPKTVSWSTQNGWYVDLSLSPGERVTVDMTSQLGILTVGTNVPDANACSPVGTSWLYFFDVTSGSFLSTSKDSVAGYFLGNSLIEGLTTIQTTSGAIRTIVVNSKGEITTEDNPPPAPSATGSRRTSWRELKN
ncbi:MAG: PilC/PilY family type IV pilus protein [Hydrogenophaga sp.]|uniref:pilus assembly protein n=1 Tax=Hydrogenophaga sp. TaxID=1904254 RepID=UPI002AB97736|nr:PilC/PilY family type IV pilus protein [Hydrogenophaga sp.]MDZ4101376.1 PilC/PilY family type IV pilus protein [Hydrogenophaga sp.]